MPSKQKVSGANLSRVDEEESKLDALSDRESEASMGFAISGGVSGGISPFQSISRHPHNRVASKRYQDCEDEEGEEGPILNLNDSDQPYPIVTYGNGDGTGGMCDEGSGGENSTGMLHYLNESGR